MVWSLYWYRGAKWSLLYHHPGSNEITTDAPHNLIQNWMRFTGECDIVEADDEGSLIVLPNVGLTATNRMNVQSRHALDRVRKYHHVMGRTWTP